jgi:protoporphyrinogen oxidase
MAKGVTRAMVLGAGVTGLAAGWASGLPVFEAEDVPGGICSSYYVRPGDVQRFASGPSDDEAYRFEVGGGHWIFGGDPAVLRFIERLTPVKRYQRRSAVYFPEKDLVVPYPLQNHLRYLGKEIAARVLQEIVGGAGSRGEAVTMADWLRAKFGPTLYELFFKPFHELYTAGLLRQIAPQDSYKTPVDLSLVIQGAFHGVPEVGYNSTFLYPQEGLNVLAQRMATRCQVHYCKRVVRIDVTSREVHFDDGTSVPYGELISTLPLNRVMEMTGLDVGERADPATSVLVVNIGAVKGPKCPSEHWLYIPRSRAGFHRVGFYSAVDPSFLPVSARKQQDRVSLYVEKAYQEGARPADHEITLFASEVVRELQEWGWITEVEVVDPTWIDVAYTWSWPGSAWRAKAIKALERHGVYQVGRYARWAFQGIADSMKEGFVAGSVLNGRV